MILNFSVVTIFEIKSNV